MEKTFEEMVQSVETIRDEKRPTFENVVAVFDTLFKRFGLEADIRQVLRGPDTWSWLDATSQKWGSEKWFILGKSTMAGTEGYPLLTIRQTTSPRLDSWVTMSQLVMGPTDEEIEQSLAHVIRTHMGAMFGVYNCVDDVMEQLGGMEAVQELVANLADDTQVDKTEMN